MNKVKKQKNEAQMDEIPSETERLILGLLQALVREETRKKEG